MVRKCMTDVLKSLAKNEYFRRVSLGIPTRSNTNQAVLSQKVRGQARGLKFWELREILVIMQLISTFVFAYAKSRFSHDAAHIGMEFSFVCKMSDCFCFFSRIVGVCERATE